MSKLLPFERGRTFSDAGMVTMDDGTYSHLEGQRFKCEDTVHGTGQKITLLVVKNDTGAAITAARKFYKFSVTDAKDFGRRVAGVASTAGMVCKPLDDAYTVGFSIPAGDLFYVTDEGWGTVQSAAGTVNVAAGEQVATTALGLIGGAAAAAGEYAAGWTDQALTTASTDYRIWINGGLCGGIVGT